MTKTSDSIMTIACAMLLHDAIGNAILNGCLATLNKGCPTHPDYRVQERPAESSDGFICATCLTMWQVAEKLREGPQLNETICAHLTAVQMSAFFQHYAEHRLVVSKVDAGLGGGIMLQLTKSSNIPPNLVPNTGGKPN